MSASVIAFQSDHLSAVPEFDFEEDSDAGSFNKKRDESLIQSTKARTAELKKRLHRE